jgi:hypothetical protein
VSDDILLEPGNPFDFDRADLEELAASLSQLTDTPARVAIRDERGYGVTAMEVLHVWLPDADALVNAAMLLSHLTNWAKDRQHRERRDHPDEPVRTRYVDLLGPDGTAISRVEIADSIPRVVELPVEDHPRRRRPSA